MLLLRIEREHVPHESIDLGYCGTYLLPHNTDERSHRLDVKIARIAPWSPTRRMKKYLPWFLSLRISICTKQNDFSLPHANGTSSSPPFGHYTRYTAYRKNVHVRRLVTLNTCVNLSRECRTVRLDIFVTKFRRRDRFTRINIGYIY